MQLPSTADNPGKFAIVVRAACITSIVDNNPLLCSVTIHAPPGRPSKSQDQARVLPSH